MNPIPKQVLVLGAIAMLAAGAFPPWSSVTTSVMRSPAGIAATQSEVPAGYAPIWEPPQPASADDDYHHVSIKLDWSRLLDEWLVVAVLTGAGFLYFKDCADKTVSDWLKGTHPPAPPTPGR